MTAFSLQQDSQIRTKVSELVTKINEIQNSIRIIKGYSDKIYQAFELSRYTHNDVMHFAQEAAIRIDILKEQMDRIANMINGINESINNKEI